MCMTQSARDWHISPLGVRPRTHAHRFYVALMIALALHTLLAVGLWCMLLTAKTNEAPTPVINARLQHEQPQQQLAQQQTQKEPQPARNELGKQASSNDQDIVTTDTTPITKSVTTESTARRDAPEHTPPRNQEHPPALNQKHPPISASPEAQKLDTPASNDTLVALVSEPKPITAWQADDALSLDPLERDYQQQVLAHLRQHLIVPAHLHGEVRIRFTVRYRHIATDVRVLEHEGHGDLAAWINRHVLQANPFPTVPAELPDPWSFSPTLIVPSP